MQPAQRQVSVVMLCAQRTSGFSALSDNRAQATANTDITANRNNWRTRSTISTQPICTHTDTQLNALCWAPKVVHGVAKQDACRFRHHTRTKGGVDLCDWKHAQNKVRRGSILAGQGKLHLPMYEQPRASGRTITPQTDSATAHATCMLCSVHADRDLHMAMHSTYRCCEADSIAICVHNANVAGAVFLRWCNPLRVPPACNRRVEGRPGGDNIGVCEANIAAPHSAELHCLYPLVAFTREYVSASNLGRRLPQCVAQCQPQTLSCSSFHAQC